VLKDPQTEFTFTLHGDNALSSSAEVEKEWSCTANFPHAFMASTVTVSFAFAYLAGEEWSAVFAKRVEKLQQNALQ
jgi:hypothetical protein